MKAVIMAGGEGSRLRPLTCDIPKPMARLCGRPMIEYILELLSEHGVTDAALTLRYLPDKIKDNFPDSTFAGINLSFSVEDSPLGTAGSVRDAVDYNEDFIIISGDALTDFDLSKAIEFHMKKNSAATLIVKKVDDPREYGLVRFDGDNRIRGFLEKPDYSQADSEFANTGIYILSPKALNMIPKNNNYDFASDLFPQMLKADIPIYAYPSEGYWCDIGDISTYISCQSDMLEGKVKCNIKKENIKYPPNVIINEPVYIGKDITLRSGCEIGPNAIIDDKCQVGVCAKVRDSVMLEGSWAGDKSRLTGTLMCAGSSAKRESRLFEQSVIGSGAIIGEFAEVKPNVKIWPNKVIGDKAVVYTNLKTGSNSVDSFDDCGIKGETGVDITPEFCARLGAACASVKGINKVAVSCGGGNCAKMLKDAFVSGVLSTGADAWDFGETFRSLHNFAQTFCKINLGVHFSSGVHTIIHMTQSGGMPTDRKTEREIEGMLKQSKFNRCPWSEVKQSVNMAGVSLIYQQELMSLAPQGLSGMKVQVRATDAETENMIKNTIQKLGCDEGGSAVFHIGKSGTQVSLWDQVCGYIEPEQVLAMAMLPLLEEDETVSVPSVSPDAFNRLAQLEGGRIVRYLDTPANNCDKYARAIGSNQMFVRDGLMMIVKILSYMKRTGQSLSDLYARIPDFSTAEKSVEIHCSPGRAMDKLINYYQESKSTDEGLVITLRKGTAKVVPGKKGMHLKLIAESFNAETAKEICAQLTDEISNALDRE